jgi:acyl-coenzyme A synthetase/AMP-(fatty) acid ligase
MHITDMIQYWARTAPHRPALIQPELITSYKALADAIETVGHRIGQFGLDRSGAVGVSLLNPAHLIATVFALLRNGYNTALVYPRLYLLLRPAGIRDLIYDSHGQVLSGGRNIRFDESWLPGRHKVDGPPAKSGPAEGADLIYFTSGTTGLPKKVVQTGDALSQLLEYPITCASGPHRKILVMPGLATTFGFNRVCEILNVGKTVCFAPDSSLALGLISFFGVEVVIASATQALELVKAKRKSPGLRVDTIATVFVGGGQIAREGIAGIRSALCQTVVNQYGSTEGGVVALTPFDALDDAAGGIPLPWVDLQIIDERGQPLSPGSEGHIRYRTPQLTANLAGSNDLPNVREGWFYPGDIGALTAQGVLRIHGRASDVINRGGVKVSGTRIEEVAIEFPGVKEAAACGVLGPSGMEELWVAVVPDGTVDIEDLKLKLKDHPDIGIAPDEVFILDSLPRGELGKVQKYRLKEILLTRKKAA